MLNNTNAHVLGIARLYTVCERPNANLVHETTHLHFLLLQGLYSDNFTLMDVLPGYGARSWDMLRDAGSEMVNNV